MGFSYGVIEAFEGCLLVVQLSTSYSAYITIIELVGQLALSITAIMANTPVRIAIILKLLGHSKSHVGGRHTAEYKRVRTQKAAVVEQKHSLRQVIFGGY